MNAVFTVLFVIYFWISSAVLFCVNAVICMVVAPFDPLRRAVHGVTNFWCYHYFQFNPFWKVTIEGIEHIDPKKSYVMIANHNSVADVLVLSGMYRNFKWVAKAEVLKVPFIGWNMLLNQYIVIQRGDMKSIKEMMQNCKDWLNRGASIMLFPEGTRSPDGDIKQFRDGAFRLAVDGKVPLVPIVIDGTHDLVEKGRKVINFSHRIRIKVLPPVNAADFDNSSGKMRTYVHDFMQSTLAQMRGNEA